MDRPDDSGVKRLPVADTQAGGLEGSPFVTQQFPVRQPTGYKGEFLVHVRASALRAARSRLTDLSSPSFPWRELALAVSMLATGAALSAWTSGVQIGDTRGILFFVLAPIVAVATFVSYLFCCKLEAYDGRSLRQVLDHLPDPNETSEMEAPE